MRTWQPRTECSTPFGINGRKRAESRTEIELRPGSAQRLSASTEGTLQHARLAGLRNHVLNAFRHQRKERAAALDTGESVLCVLNAFRHQRKERLGNVLRHFLSRRCSTPFGINGRNAISKQPAIPLFLVLNAFRHQRKERHGRRRHPHRPPLVLNAFRHQRKERAPVAGEIAACPVCSTPFGINGRNALELRSLPGSWRVLNAFRHQRKERFPGGEQADKVLGVLNAFRHQRKERKCPLERLGLSGGAQRLSASTEGTRR